MAIPSSLTTTTPQINRQTKLNAMLEASNLESLILNAGPSFTYMTGLHFHLSERPVLVFFVRDAVPLIVLPELEQEKLKNLPYEIRAFPYGENPYLWASVFKQAIQTAGLTGKQNGVEPRQIRLLEYQLLTSSAPGTDFLNADEFIASLRMLKDKIEIANMRKAARIAEQALTEVLQSVKIGMNERELAAELTLQLLRAGCDPQVPFSPIVSSGLNSANPHASPSDRKLASGDMLVIDWGAGYEGYCSDITRTFMIGEVDSELKRIARIVLDANTAGRDSARPGIAAEAIDKTARTVIDSAGYGKFFTHRTGHGLGMEAHEDPYIRAGNLLLLEPGMAFTIEPGIYLPGRNGVRIEDNVVITETGSDCLTSLSREVTQLV